MKTHDLIKEVYAAVTVNLVRSGLTVLGIIIGISSVITMISIGQGTQKSIEESIQSIGSNLLTVQPGSSSGVGQDGVKGGIGSADSLDNEDVAVVRNVSGVLFAAPVVSSQQQVIVKGNNTNTSIIGTSPEYASVRNIEMEAGSFLSDQHMVGYAKVAVLGSGVRDDLFGEGVYPTKETIRINGTLFTIIGVAAEKGGNGFGSSDDSIYISYRTAQQYFSGSDSINSINIQAAEEADIDAVEVAVTTALLSVHDIVDAEDADFNIMNQADIVETAASVTGTFTLLLGAIAGISLVVGGIGIMNMMLTTVTERTREIGLRKSLGAKQRDINTQFLFESIVLTLVGGVLGIFFGITVSIVLSAGFDITTSISWLSVVLAFGVSALIGIIFGYYPAQKASKFNPIEALRYE